MSSPNKILITGGTGYIGQAVVRQALASGLRVTVLTRSPQTRILPAGVTTIGGGLATPDWTAIEKFAPDICIHCAWVATPGSYLNSPENSILADQSIFLAEALMQRGLQKFVGLGTCLECISSDQPLNEESRRSEDTSPYIQAKLRLLDNLKTATGDRYAWLRIFYAYGPGEHHMRFISSAARTFALGQTLHLRRPDDVVDYIHVEDIASATLVATLKPAFGVLNVGSGQGRSVRAVAKLLAGIYARPNAVTYATQDQRKCRVADASRLHAFGWEPRFNFENAVKTMCAKVSNKSTDSQ